MRKILLVIQREYLTRVRKTSFWVLTILVPILVAGLYAVPIILATKPLEQSHVLVVDETDVFVQEFRSSESISYHDAGSLEYAKNQIKNGDSADVIVYIPARSNTIPNDAFMYYYSDAPSLNVQSDIENQLQRILRDRILLDVYGISPDDYDLITNTHIKLHTSDIETGRDGFLEVKVVVGILLALLVFMAVFIFGSQVMRGVMEEKGNRILEIIVCSVKPFQLMMGKVVGVGLVGLTQFLLWVLLSGVAMVGVSISNSDLLEQAAARQEMTSVATKGSEAVAQMEAQQQAAPISEAVQGLTAINFPLIVGMFLLYFLVGYLLYATLFAAAGSLVDSETDSQQFTLPITIPLLLSFLMLPALINEPSGSLAQWLSIIPFTSPVAMMFRIPFGVPLWQVLLSVGLLLATFPLCVWLAAKTYRWGILHYGKRTTYRDVWKVLRMNKQKSDSSQEKKKL